MEARMTDTAPEAPITHPEETRGDFDLRVAKNINFKGSGRVTPAGIVTVGLMTIGRRRRSSGRHGGNRIRRQHTLQMASILRAWVASGRWRSLPGAIVGAAADFAG
jgi:hypothetical protein